MQALPQEAAVLHKLVTWGLGQSRVRAMILTSSRARPDGPIDLLSDYDVIVAVTDADAFGREDDWLSDYARPMVRWSDKSERFGLTTYFRGVLYEDYIKIDYSVWPDALLDRVSGHAALPNDLDVGYRVLLDKDGRDVWMEAGLV